MLENDKIFLRPLELSDIDRLYEWENNRDNWRVSNSIAPYSKHTLKAYISAVIDIYTDKQLRLIIETKPDREAVGAVDLFDCDFINKRVGIGILIADPQKRGQGIGTAVIDEMLSYVFNVLGLHQVYCSVLTDNAESLALFKKFDFETIGVKKHWRYYNGEYLDVLMMQKINKDG